VLAPGHLNAVPEIATPALLTGRTGRVGAASSADRAAALVGLGASGGMEALPVVAGAAGAARNVGDLGYVTEFPLRIDRVALRRGQQRFNIFCLPCHGETGKGNGKIVERGYLPPPSYLTDESRGLRTLGYHVPLRDVPVGYFFEVITEGYGAMPSYSQQVPPDDRWKIAAYIRALQLAQYARLADLPAPQRDAVRKELENKP
jgi:mono/diheme cytochrome c family protein